MLYFLLILLIGAAPVWAQSCSFGLEPSVVNVPAVGNATTDGSTIGLIVVTASSSSCNRPAASTVPSWIMVTFGSTGTGNGSVGYSVVRNRAPFSRTGTITIGTAVFTVNQAAASCNYALDATTFNAGFAKVSRTVRLTTTCEWQAASNVTWITLDTDSISGVGNATITFSVAENTTPALRTGTFAVGTQTFTVTQQGTPCNFQLGPASVSLPASGGSGSFSVSAAIGCEWQATATGFAGITITGSSSGSGVGTVAYSVAANTFGLPRTGSITVGGKTFVINQAAAVCNFALVPGAIAVPPAGGQGSFTVTTSCSWSPSSNVPWVTITSSSTVTGNGTVSFTAAANTGADSRAGAIAVGTSTALVTQAGLNCNYSIAPTSVAASSLGATGSVTVIATSACQWTATSNAAWISASPSAGSGGGSVSYTVSANPGGNPRTGTLTIAGQTFTVNQAGPGSGVGISSAGVTNAASYAARAVAPGEIVTIFGTGIGPPTIAPYELTADGLSIATTLAGTRVLFDGVAAPLLYVLDFQLSAIVPYSVAGSSSTALQVEYNGVRSNVVSLEVAAAAPGVFTLDNSGTGEAAVLNGADYTGINKTNPAARGSVILIYATGEGQTNPGGLDGKLTTGELPRPVQRVTVTIGGIDARVLYAGGAPGLVAGLLQINAEVPAGVTPGDAVPLVVRVGDAASQAGVTIAVK